MQKYIAIPLLIMISGCTTIDGIEKIADGESDEYYIIMNTGFLGFSSRELRRCKVSDTQKLNCMPKGKNQYYKTHKINQ